MTRYNAKCNMLEILEPIQSAWCLEHMCAPRECHHAGRKCKRRLRRYDYLSPSLCHLSLEVTEAIVKV